MNYYELSTGNSTYFIESQLSYGSLINSLQEATLFIKLQKNTSEGEKRFAIQVADIKKISEVSPGRISGTESKREERVYAIEM